MKKIILLLLGISFSPFAFGQAATTLDQAIEQQVQQQTSPNAAANGTTPSVSQRRVTVNPNDTRVAYVGGQLFQLRLKQDQSNENGQFHTHKYVNQTDTMTVDMSQAYFELRPKKPRGNEVPAGYTLTSQEQLNINQDTQGQIMACEKKNPDGSCEYIVRKTERTSLSVPNHSSNQITKGTVTVKQTFAPGTDTNARKANTYQSIKNTPVYPTFSVNINRGGRNDLYGPESYGQ